MEDKQKMCTSKYAGVPSSELPQKKRYQVSSKYPARDVLLRIEGLIEKNKSRKHEFNFRKR